MESAERNATRRNSRARKVIVVFAIWTRFGLTARFVLSALAAEPYADVPAASGWCSTMARPARKTTATALPTLPGM